MAKKQDGKTTGQTLPAVTGGGGAVAAWEAELSIDAEDAAAMFKPAGGSGYITPSGGHFTFQGGIIDEQMRNVIVLGYALDYAYYPDTYNRENPVPPACWAIEEVRPKADAEGIIKPPMDVPSRQIKNGETCAVCWANKWASADRGRAKACKNSYRLVLAAVPENVPDALINPESTIDIARLRIPPTSMKLFAGYARQLGRQYRKAPFGVITQFSLKPAANVPSGMIEPALKRMIAQEEAQRVLALREAAMDDLMQPYDTSQYELRRSTQGTARKTGNGGGAPPATGRGFGTQSKQGGSQHATAARKSGRKY